MENNLATLKNKVNEKLIELQEIVSKEFPHITPPRCKVLYNLKSKRTLGLADFIKKEIRLNEGLLEEYGEVYINNTFVHEYAHFVVNELYPLSYNVATKKKVMPHGKEFKEVCALFGIQGKARSGLYRDSQTLKEIKSQKSRKLVRHPYRCSCQEHLLSIRMHNNIQIRNATYICNYCRKKLEYVGS